MHLVVRATVAAARPHARNHVTRLAFRAASGSVRNRQLSTSAPRSDLGPSNTEKPETSSGSARSESDLALWEEIEEMEEEDQFDWDAEAEEPTSEDRKLLHQSLDDQISLLHLLKKMESTETGKRVEYTEALRDTERKHGWLRGVKLPPSWIHALESGSTNSMDPEDRGQFLAMMNVARISQRSDWTVAPGELPSRFKEAMKMGQYEHLSTRDQKVLHSLVKDLLLLGVLAPKRDVLDLEKHVKAVRQREGYVPNKDEAATIKHVRSHNKEAVPMSDELNQSIHFVQQAHSLGHLDSLLAGPKGRDYKGDKVALAARDAALANGDVDLLSSEQQDRLHDAVTGEQDLVEEAQTLQQHIIETDLGVGREFGALRRLAYLIQFTNDYGDMLSEKPRMWVEKYRELLDIYGMGEGTKRQREHDDARATVEYDDERAPKRDPEAQPEKIGEAKFRRQGRRSEMDDPDEAEEDMAAEEAEGAWTSSERYRLERAFAASRGVVHLEDWPKRWQAAVWARGTMQKDVLDEVVGVERALLWKSVNRRLQILAQSHYEQKGELEARLSPTPGANTPQIRFLSDMHRLQQIDRAVRKKPRYLSRPEKIDKTYGVPVATIHFRSHEIPLLELFIYFVQHAVSALGIPSTGVAMLPSRRRLWTVPRSPFIFKKSQENFERITHKRAIKLWDANAQVLGFLERYIAKHEMGGVGVRVVRWERVPLGIGEVVYINALQHPESHREMLENASKRVLKAEKKAMDRLRDAQKEMLKAEREIRQQERFMANKAAAAASTAAARAANDETLDGVTQGNQRELALLSNENGETVPIEQR